MERIVGKTPVSIDAHEDDICMKFSDGTSCIWYHEQDCCESVWVDDVNGEWDDLIGTPLLVADERDGGHATKGGECEQWTFYTFRSIKGSVDVRWYGDSNGYYSTSVDFRLRPNHPQTP